MFDGSFLYGVTEFGGGATPKGVLFKVIPAGTEDDDGSGPFAGVVMDNGILYGTTVEGGNNIDGTLFSFDLNTNTLTTERDFQGPLADAGIPFDGVVTDGARIYGTSANGGANSEGAIYAFDPNTDTFELLHSFEQIEGASPRAGLLLVGNQLFGTTAFGGPDDDGTAFAINTDGSGFQMLGSFPFDADTFGSPQGRVPQAELIRIGDYLYGTASFGGLPSDYGTIFRVQIPEPSALTLLAAGGLLILRRRRVHR